MKKVLVVAGVTGAGKTKLGIELAKRYNGEIISADSVAIYRELNIGSAKPTEEEQQEAIHHMIDIIDVDAAYSVAHFQKDARLLIESIHKKGKLPIVVGGTGLYINALLNDYEFMQDSNETIDDDPNITNEQLYERLLKEHPDAAKDIHPNNRKRVLRALIRKEHNNQGNKSVYDGLILFLQGDRSILHDRINQRVDLMMERGLLEEVSNLYQHHPQLFNYQSMQSIGYREFRAYFEEGLPLSDVIESIKTNTRRFAKRQITWFKNKTNSSWIDLNHTEESFAIIDKWLSNKTQ